MTETQFPTGAAVVGQSGGPTAAINATLAGVIRACLSREANGKITSLYGMKNGIEGFLEDRLIDLFPPFLTPEGVPDEEKLFRLERTPAAALGSCRVKLPSYSPDETATGVTELPPEIVFSPSEVRTIIGSEKVCTPEAVSTAAVFPFNDI